MAYTVSVANGCSGATLGLPGVDLGNLVLRSQESSDDSSRILYFSLQDFTGRSQTATLISLHSTRYKGRRRYTPDYSAAVVTEVLFMMPRPKNSATTPKPSAECLS